MEIIQAKIEELKPAEYNPRAMTEKEKKDLTESILRFGMVEPIVVNVAENRKNIIISGHQRFYICKELGWKEIPVVYVSIPEIEKEKELNLRLNKNMGHWDWDLLANFDESLLLDIGFEAGEIDEIFGLKETDIFDEQEEFDKAVKEPKGVKTGEIWKLGDHKLLIGDCTKKENWEKLLGKEKFDFMFTDPPYRLAYCKKRVRKVHTKDGWKIKKEREYNSVGETERAGKPKGFGAKQNRIYEGVEMKGGVPEYDEWLSIANEFQNSKGANVMIFENWRNTVELWQAIEKYWKIRNMIIWHLPNRMQGFAMRQQFFNKYDIAPLAGDGIINEETEEEAEKYLIDKGQKLLDTYEVILYGKKGDSVCDKKKGTQYAKISDHITWVASTEKSAGQSVIFGTKPIQILVPYIKILSPRNGIVMEPFGGSGSAIIASEIMKRQCRAIEISPLYAEVIIARFEKFTGKRAEIIGN
jgi:DNA modification methylase